MFLLIFLLCVWPYSCQDVISVEEELIGNQKILKDLEDCKNTNRVQENSIRDFQEKWSIKEGLPCTALFNVNTQNRRDLQELKSIRSMEECSIKCLEKPTCNFWSWHHKDAGTWAFDCVLMSGFGSTRLDGNVITGAKNCPRATWEPIEVTVHGKSNLTDSQTSNFSCSARGGRAPFEISLNEVSQDIMSRDTINVTAKKNVKEIILVCSVKDFYGFTSQGIKVIPILVGPNPSFIHLLHKGNSKIVEAGSVQDYECLTGGATPAPKIDWKILDQTGQELVVKETSKTETENGGYSKIQVFMKENWTNLTITCIVSNDVGYESKTLHVRIIPQAIEENLQFEQLLFSEKGRHFLLTTLLEKHNEPLSTPRYQGNVIFQLPSTLGGNIIPTPYPCCQLDHVPGGSGILSILDVKSHLGTEDILQFKRGTSPNDFSPEVKKAVMKLVNYINNDNGEERQFRHMLSIAAAVKDLVNQDLFAKAVVTIFLRRNDVGNAVPPVSEILGASFFPMKLRDQVDRLPISLRSSLDVRKEVVIDWSDPKYATYPDDEPEKKLWYIREDPEMNSHHWFWHILFGDTEFYNKDKLQHRRGELFWYLHNQVCNRYNVERLSNGMDLVEPFGPQQWNHPIPLGYDSKLGKTTVNYFPPRPDNVTWTGGRESTIEMMRRATELSNSIRKGYMIDPQGRKVPLEYKNGRDMGIIPLGATVETDPLRTVNNETYGDLHNGGHDIMATAGLHQQLIDRGFKSAIGTTATECRDPLLYRWHAYIDGVFAEYKQTLPHYTDKELAFSQIIIQDVDVYSYQDDDDNSRNGQTYRKNELFTHMEDGDVGYYGLDGIETSDKKIRVKYKRLNHSPFVYRFNVRNSGKPVQGMVRIFLAADVGTPTMIEMDKFIWTFDRGDTNFDRSFDDSSSVPRKARGLYEIQDLSLNSVDGIFDSEILEYSGCGWPKHLLVPRGNPQGFQMKILIVISKLLPGDDAATTDWETVSGLSHSLCGAPGAKFPDSQPMGFPFDRYRGYQNIMAGRSNMRAVNVTIYHQGECSTNADCLDHSGCNKEIGRCNSRNPLQLSSHASSQAAKPSHQLNLFFNQEKYCMTNNSVPKLKQNTLYHVGSAKECQKSCAQTEGCAHFEWQGKAAGTCVVYTDIIYEKTLGLQSMAGPSQCNKETSKSSGGASRGCWKKNRKPSVTYVKTWENVASAEKCQKLCRGEAGCQSVEWERTIRLGYGDCHAFKVKYVTKTDSWSGPVSC